MELAKADVLELLYMRLQSMRNFAAMVEGLGGKQQPTQAEEPPIAHEPEEEPKGEKKPKGASSRKKQSVSLR